MSIPEHGRRGARFNLRHNSRLTITALSIALCTFTYGYDSLVMGNVLAIPAFAAQFYSDPDQLTLTDTEISVIAAVPVSGALIGLLVVSHVGDKYGRRRTIQLSCLISVIGAVIQLAAASIAVLTVGRFLTSLSVFIMVSMAVAFQSEVAPPMIRGMLGAACLVAVNLGVMLSAGISFGTWKLTNSAAYRVPMGMQGLWPVVVSLGILYTMDSPTSFLIKGDDVRAETSLRKIRKGYTDREVAEELASLKLQKSLRKAENEVPWTQLFRGPNLRRTLLAAYIGNVQVLTGLWFSTGFAIAFLSATVSDDGFLLAFGISIIALGGVLAGMLVVDQMGRRTLALSSSAVIFVIDVIVGVMGCFDLGDPDIQKTLAAFFLLFGFFFAAGFGPLVYINPAEMPTARLRNKTSALTFFLQSCNSIVCIYVFPYLITPDAGNRGVKVYLMFAGCMLTHFVIVFFVFPELKGRTPAEIDEMFEKRLPARKFKGYVCAVAPEHVGQELVAKEPLEEIVEVDA